MLRIISMAVAITLVGYSVTSTASEPKSIYHGETGRTAADYVKCVATKWEGRSAHLAVADAPNGKRITVTAKGKTAATLDAITTDSLTNVDIHSDAWPKDKADAFVEDARGCI
ncbi:MULTISPECIES: hypothetical protein [Dyella]|uniref:Uncharacterized protein n=2 Tax=Dyella TaxID=231454 RepID=A0A4R0YH63_9GAMM|nr:MULTISPECIES: hypothetical protein [Dyella]TBR37158.1 hypothetical protein EYV96_14845 [Dyella terrae]TCI07752.1 hypothetical protein EZM97_24025 [Dyella soli]